MSNDRASKFSLPCCTNFQTSEEKQNVAFIPYPADTELEFSDSVVQVKLGSRNVHVVVSNPTNQPVILEKRLVLGSIETVSAIIPWASMRKTQIVGLNP